MKNLEIKAKVEDLRPLRNIAAKIGAAPTGKERQVDTYFNVPRGRLKIRESALSGNELIAYFRGDSRAPKESDYRKVRVVDPAHMKEALDKILGTRAVVVKEREVFLFGAARIHLDEVEGLGVFIEFEILLDSLKEDDGPPDKLMEMLMDTFNVNADDLVDVSYADMSVMDRKGPPV